MVPARAAVPGAPAALQTQGPCAARCLCGQGSLCGVGQAGQAHGLMLHPTPGCSEGLGVHVSYRECDLMQNKLMCFPDPCPLEKSSHIGLVFLFHLVSAFCGVLNFFILKFLLLNFNSLLLIFSLN